MKFEPEIKAAAEKHGIPFRLLAAQVMQESSGNPDAVSPCGAEGLLQIMPGTQGEVGLDPMDPRDEFDPAKNLDAGALYLKRQYKAVKRIIETLPKKDSNVGKEGMKGANNLCMDADYWMMALAAYNGGLGYIISAIKLCVADGLSIHWENVSLFLRNDRCQVRGKRPDHKQMIDYVTKIFINYKKAAV